MSPKPPTVEFQNIPLLKESYRLQYDLDRFTNKRVDRLCQAAGITLEALCAMAGVFGKVRIKALYRQAEKREQQRRERIAARRKARMGQKPEHLPPVEMWLWPWEIALHFAKIERFYFEQKFISISELGPDEVHLAIIQKPKAT